MLITALKEADGDTRAELERWITAGAYDPSEKIAAVTAIYNKVGVGDICREQIGRYYEEGIALMEQVSVETSRKKNLLDFVLSLMDRNL